MLSLQSPLESVIESMTIQFMLDLEIALCLVRMQWAEWEGEGPI